MYGGAAGGGKTDALLMGGLQFVDTPGYAALVLMRTYKDLSLPGAGISRAREWLSGSGAKWDGDSYTWRFPSGATLTFGYLQNEGDEQRYRTAEFQYVAFDELTRFPEQAYRFLFSRLRRLAGSSVPIRMRSATNPGGKGHEWVRSRFVPDDYLREKAETRFARPWWKDDRLFVPARRADNPHLDQDEYARSLAELLPLDRAQQDEGDWSAHTEGHWKRHWFRSYRAFTESFLLDPQVEHVLRSDCFVVSVLDPNWGESETNDHAAIVTAAITPRRDILILDVVRERLGVENVVPRLALVCRQWHPSWVVIENAGGSIAYIREARNTPGIPTIMAISPEGKDKLARAVPAVLRAEQGTIYLPSNNPPWLEPYLSELCSFTGDDTLDASDDQVDATAYLIIAVDRYGIGRQGGETGGRGARRNR